MEDAYITSSGQVYAPPPPGQGAFMRTNNGKFVQFNKNDHFAVSKYPERIQQMQQAMGSGASVPPTYNGMTISYKSSDDPAKRSLTVLEQIQKGIDAMVAKVDKLQNTTINNYGGQFGPSTIKDALRVTQVV